MTRRPWRGQPMPAFVVLETRRLGMAAPRRSIVKSLVPSYLLWACRVVSRRARLS